MRLSIAAAAACLSIVGFAAADQAAAAIKKFTDIPAQELGSALQSLAQDRDFQVVYLSDSVDKLRTSGAVGEFTADEALKKLLRGTGLSYRYLDEKTITVLPARGGAAMSSKGSSGVRANAEGDGASAVYGSGDSGDSEGAKNTSLWDRFRLAQVDTGTSSGSSSVTGATADAQDSAAGRGLSEIVVTAQKKSERLQDVPVPVTVLNTEDLAANGLNRIQDYFATVPGLSLSSNSGGLVGTQSFAIRGITTTVLGNPTVAVAIDDVPFGSSQYTGFGSMFNPDVDPSDLDRIEVLRGPQGTLYGTDSLGGLIKYVTKDPSTAGVSGHVQVLGNDVEHGEFGYGVRGAVNVPLSDSFAIRVSAFTRRDPGYIENVTTGQSDVNRVDTSGGRLAALWRPSDDFSLKVSALLQDTDGNGPSLVNANSASAMLQSPRGNLQQTGLPGTGGFKTKVYFYTATLTARFAGLDLVSTSGYADMKYASNLDAEWLTCCVPGLLAGTDPTNLETRKFTQELRLSSSLGPKLDWLAGVFYTHEYSPDMQNDEANDPVTGAPVTNSLTHGYEYSKLSEYALFGDVTVHFTDQFDIQFGGRESGNQQSYSYIEVGPMTQPLFGVPSPYVEPLESIHGRAFTYLVTPRLKLSPDLMAYMRFTSGYRIGGVNLLAEAYHTPIAYDPDTTRNYELGFKGDLLEHKLAVDASVYHIDWQRIQVALYPPVGVVYTINGGKAKSDGVELSLQARPLPGLSIGAVVSVNDAKLTEDFPQNSFGAGLAGDRLPYSSRFSGTLTADQDFAMVSRWRGFVGGALSYVGNRIGEFNSPGLARMQLPSYTYFNLHTGIRDESWQVNLFLNNVSNRRGITGGSPAYNQGNASGITETIIQPRTVGLSVSRNF